jgi:hypothetical protein
VLSWFLSSQIFVVGTVLGGPNRRAIPRKWFIVQFEYECKPVGHSGPDAGARSAAA